MAYIHIGDDTFPGGSLGCGLGCPCGPCRSAAARLGQWYVRDEEATSESEARPSEGSAVQERGKEARLGWTMGDTPPSGRLNMPPMTIRWIGRRLGEAPAYMPWRVRLGIHPKPQYLRFMNLDQFNWNEASLTPRLRQMVGHLAKHVQLSWKSMQPIGFIRLTGHTDNTGKHDYNVDLGNRRARAVKEELENILKEDILKGRIRIAILVDPSPGASAPTADNSTSKGRALNRRVEVFVAPPEPLPEPKKKPIITITEPPPGSVIQTKPGDWGRIPPGPPGKSLESWLDERLKR
ncbi:MAG: OmpA family protein, partial [Pyrinomonadaceae bacterium]